MLYIYRAKKKMYIKKTLTVCFPTEPCEPVCHLMQNIPAPTPAAPAGGSSGAPAASTSSMGGAGPSGGVGAIAATHHSPYDLRRKSPSHHDALPGVAGPSTSAATAGSPTSPATPTAPAQGYSSVMLPARKRPRRTCSTSYEGEG